MIESWLELLCKSIPRVHRAAVIRAHGGKAVCIWPRASWSDTEIAASKKLNLASVPDTGNWVEDGDVVRFLYPLKANDVRFATLVLESHVALDQVAAVLQLLTWSQLWLELLATQNREKTQQTQHLLSVIERSSAYDNLTQNSFAFCSHLVDQLSLSQAVFCLIRNKKVSVLSVSKSPDLDARTQPFIQLTNFLEGVDGKSKAEATSVFEEWLLRNDPNITYQSFPLTFNQNTFAYLVVYFPKNYADVALVKAQISLFLRYLTPMYFKLYRAQLSVRQRVLDSVFRAVSDSKRRQRFLYSAGLCVVCLLAALIPVDRTVTGNAQIEGLIQRAVVAPEDGYLQDIFVKAGDLLKQGQLMATLDEKSVRLELQRWQNEKQEFEREYNRELTALNHVQMRIAQAKMAQAQAKLQQFQNRLEKIRIHAPIDGVVIKGDLSRAVGAPVKEGQVLYEMAPINDFKLILLVSEHAVSELRVGQLGSLKLNAFPGETLPFEVVAISSVFEESATQLQYRIEAKLQNSLPGLKPGMTGKGRVIVGRHAWLYGLAEPLISHLRIWLWMYLG